MTISISASEAQPGDKLGTATITSVVEFGRRIRIAYTRQNGTADLDFPRRTDTLEVTR